MSAAGAGAGAPGAGDQPPLPGTQPPAAPPPAAPPAPPARQPQRPPQQSRSQRRHDRQARRNGKPQQTPFDQNPSVLKRIRQEAARILRREIGEDLTIDQVKELVAKAKGQPPAPAAPPPAAGPSAREKKLAEENADLQARVKKQNKKLKKMRSRNERDATRGEMRLEARSAGIQDRYFNFAMTELGEYLTAYGANPDGVPPEVKAALAKEPDIDARAVFAYIKAQHPMIAEQPPVVVPINPTTAPPASRQPGERVPPPKPGTEKPPAFDASKLSDEEWAAEKRKRGWRF